jgi:hypothetical protein
MTRMLPLAALFAAATAFAHHGWSEYDADKPLTLTGTIAASGYTQPHGHVELKTADKTWHVVLAPPSRMESRGLPKDMLAAAGINAALFHMGVYRGVAHWDAGVAAPALARAQALLSLLLWAAIVACGRLLAYT